MYKHMTEISFIYKKNDYQYLKMDTVILNDESVEIDKDQKYENIVIDKTANFKGLTIGVDDISRSNKYINLNPDNLSLKELYFSIFNKKWNIPKNDIERRLSVLVKIFNHMLENKDSFGNILKNFGEKNDDISCEEESDDNDEDCSSISKIGSELEELRYSIKKEVIDELKSSIKDDILPKFEEKIMENISNKKESNSFSLTLLISNIVISFGIVIFYDLYKFEI